MGNSAIYLRNSEGKEWLIQTKYCRTGCELYQPSAWRGKLVVRMLPVLAKFPLPFFRTVPLNAFIPENVLQCIQEIFGDECNCSAFMGTPGTHKKATIQVSRRNEICGYVKYSRDPVIRKLFEAEQKKLVWLREKSVSNIPECMALRVLEDSTEVFVQSTKKQLGTKIEHKFGNKQKQFLDSLYEMTKAPLRFEYTDFFKTIQYVRRNIQNADVFRPKEQAIVEQAIQSLLDVYSNRIVEFCVCHRDFTPWNTCVTGNALFVFDWEYAQKTYPRGIDQCHFLIQTKKFEQHLSMDRIAKDIKESNYYGLGKLIFLAYCLDHAAIYMQRNKADDWEKVKEDIRLLGYIES